MSEFTDIEGVISKRFEKTGSGQRGPWKKLSYNIDGTWVNFGFLGKDNADPGYHEGQVVKFRCTEDQYGFQVKQHRASDEQPKGSAKTSTGGSTNSTQQSIHYQNSRNVAVQFLEVLAGQDALPITAASGKANKAKRFDELNEVLDKLTVKFFHDAETLRVLEQHADGGGIQDNDPQPLPDGEVDPSEDDDDEDIPF